MIGKTISHYKILEKLGGGGMGVVYKAEDLKLHRLVALKFLPPELTLDEEAKKRFVHEAEAASSLDHNNICVIHEIDETDGQIFICMNYYEGETLKKKIEKGLLKIDEAADIALQIAKGLEKAHEKGIVHRDIKPANIFITSDGVVKILDFGLAKLMGYTVLTKVGETLGTTAYMSPEQSRGEKTDYRTDIWSFGIVLYEMVTGKLPFKGDYGQAVMPYIEKAKDYLGIN
jgi:eukaryotic-like serine/threonine-protein kinase